MSRTAIKTIPKSINFSIEELARIEEVARRLGKSRNALVKKFVNEGLDALEKQAAADDPKHERAIIQTQFIALIKMLGIVEELGVKNGVDLKLHRHNAVSLSAELFADQPAKID